MHPAVASLYSGALQFAVGLYLASWITDLRGEVTPGFLRINAVTAACGALVALMVGVSVGGAERLLVQGFAVLAFFVFLQHWLRRGRARLITGGLLAGIGVVALILGGVDRPSPILGPGWTALVSIVSALALGGSMSALILGHWYLMTPRLTARPLKLLCDVTIISLVMLTGVASWYVAFHPETIVLGPRDPVLLWIGLLAIGVFPIGVTIAARLCCIEWPRGRALQAATGLLYVVATLVLAGALAGNMVVLGGTTG
ncbi:MAG: hypothetical protein ACKVVP_24835 [Chloroflexota bacterium]